jgi:Tol biopolymer transport system component
MNDPTDGPPPASAGERRRLDSWKEIAAYFGRGVRTVQRWEREEGLPVHRLAHAERGSVFADPTELNAWWKSRQIEPSARLSSSPAVAEPRLQRVTSMGAATFWPALSSDARMVVYVSDGGQDGAAPQVWLQQLGGAAVQLSSDMRECAEPTFSADDTRVVFSAAADSTRHVFEMPALGGQPRVLKRTARNGRWSPDGRWLVYLAIDSLDAVRLVSDTGEERVLTTGLVDIASATWSDDSRYLLVVGHPDPSAELDCWIVPVDGGAAVDTGVLRHARRRDLVVISMATAWTGHSIFFTAANRQGIHVWRQRIVPKTFQPDGTAEMMTPGNEAAYFPTVSRGRLCFVSVHADTNMWSVSIDARTGKADGAPRRLTRGPGLVSNFSVSRDGSRLAYFSAGPTGIGLHVKDLLAGTDTTVDAGPAVNRGFPVISLDGQQLAFSMLVPGPPVRRPVYVANLADGASRQVFEDCGGRARLWLDDHLLLAETFGSGLNSFVVLDTRDATQRPLLSSRNRRLSNARLSPDSQWLAFDATRPGGAPSVLVTRLHGSEAADEDSWVCVDTAASHPFWSQDGRLLYYLPATPTTDIRNKLLARAFDPIDGHVGTEPTEVLTLSETIVPAMISAVGPIVAGNQIILLLGNYRGDIWMLNLQASG